MQRKRSRVALVGALALVLSVSVGLAVGGSAAAKKKKKSKVGGIVDITKAVNAPIPNATATTNGLLASTIDVGGNTFRGTLVRDVNVTIQTLGATGATPADNLEARLTAPNGATTWLFAEDGPLAGISIGPLTLDDESANIYGGLPPAPNATTLVAPYAGIAQPDCAFVRGGCAFSAMDNGAVSGTWTLRVYDVSGIGETSILSSWRLNVVAGKAFQTK